MKTAIKKGTRQKEHYVMHIEITNDLVHGRKQEELQGAVQEGLLIRDYLNAEISIGKFAEQMGMSLVEGRNWLHNHGIATTRSFVDPKLKKTSEENYRKVSKALGIPVAQKDT